VALRKDCEENKSSLAKLRENLQNVLKKVKEEFTQNKTETQAAIDSINSQLKTQLVPATIAPSTQA
jgi:ElaB/YqjD/DUF883 family membrane-anchored ribosome-binding protein